MDMKKQRQKGTPGPEEEEEELANKALFAIRK